MAEKRVSLLKRANKLFRQGKADAAIKEYKKILAIKPDDLEVRRIVGDLELRQSNTDGAIEQFEWIADYYLKEGFFAKAIAMFKRITRVNPSYEGALIKLADLYTKQGLVMEAKHIYLDIAEECKRQNNQAKALDMYKKILEFDRSNIKMRLLLADNYLKEGLEDNAISEYLTAADIILAKKDFHRAEELLVNTKNKVKNSKVIEKLVSLYNKQDEDDKAIALLSEMGEELHQNSDLLKVLGELYLKKNAMDEAEKIFSRIVEIDPNETEIIMRLGKVYLQREEYDKTFNLFVPIIDKNIAAEKFEDATSLLRFIIASDNTYIPALVKLAEIFRLSNKTNNLIALYESLIPIYEQKGMNGELKKTLEELIELSDTPFSYEEQLARLTGKESKVVEEAEAEKEGEREKEFVNFNLRLVDDALKVSDIDKAVDILVKSKATFPRNIEIREKLFSVYFETEKKEKAVNEGKSLLELYKYASRTHEYSDLIGKLSTLEPEDEKLVQLSTDEKTSIDIDFSQVDLQEQIQEISDEADLDDRLDESGESDVLVLSAESLQAPSDAIPEEALKPSAESISSQPFEEPSMDSMPEPLSEPFIESDPVPPAKAAEEDPHSLSSVLAEVDFYVNDGYFGDAEKLIRQLKDKYPDNQKLIDKIERLQKAKNEAISSGEMERTDAGLILEDSDDIHTELEIESSQVDQMMQPPDSTPLPEPLDLELEPSSGPVAHGHTERIDQTPEPMEELVIEPSFSSSPGVLDYQSQSQDPGVVIDIPDIESQAEVKVEAEETSGLHLGESDFALDDYMAVDNGLQEAEAPPAPPEALDLDSPMLLDAEPEPLEPEPLEPELLEPEPVEPMSLDPKLLAPEQLAPEPLEPEPLEPELLEPELPEPAIPEPLEPEPMTLPEPEPELIGVPETVPEEKAMDQTGSSSSHSFNEDSSMLKISEQAFSGTDRLLMELEQVEEEAESEDDVFELEPGTREAEPESVPAAEASGDAFQLDQSDAGPLEIESSIAEESHMVQEHEDSKIGIKIDDLQLEKIAPSKPVSEAQPFEDLEIEMDSDVVEEEPLQEMQIDKDLLIQSPSVDPKDDPKEKSSEALSSSGVIEFDLNSIMIEEEAGFDTDSPFSDDISGGELDLESEEELLEADEMFLEDAFLEPEKSAPQELEAIAFWLKELENQRTSTIEKNMMEIFEEFKRGVDEKIGQEDYDTRYNLGIAYKEMGLLEEAIHEFLIAAKHPLKFFDSAGLLGMCFREKGMFTEAVNWFDRALDTPDRRKEEYLAVRYELVITLKLKEDYRRALKLCVDILKIDQSYRDVADIYRELKGYITR